MILGRRTGATDLVISAIPAMRTRPRMTANLCQLVPIVRRQLRDGLNQLFIGSFAVAVMLNPGCFRGRKILGSVERIAIQNIDEPLPRRPDLLLMIREMIAQPFECSFHLLRSIRTERLPDVLVEISVEWRWRKWRAKPWAMTDEPSCHEEIDCEGQKQCD